MDNKKIKINIIFVIIVILLIVTALMIRFEINPISYFVGGNDDEEETVEVAINYNGVYRYRESLKDSYKLKLYKNLMETQLLSGEPRCCGRRHYECGGVCGCLHCRRRAGA
jgi:hypothetical protein